MKKTIWICIALLTELSAGQSGIAPDLSLVPKGDLISFIRKRVNQGDSLGYLESIPYLKEIEKRGSSLKDWEEYKVKQTLAFCLYATGQTNASYIAYTELGSLDTAKYFGEKPKQAIFGADILYNRILLSQKFNAVGGFQLDSSINFLRLVDSLAEKYPNYVETDILLFNKSLYLFKAGKKQDAEATIRQIKKDYPGFKLGARLDSLHCLVSKTSCQPLSENKRGQN